MDHRIMEKTKELYELMKAHPGLEVIPMIVDPGEVLYWEVDYPYYDIKGRINTIEKGIYYCPDEQVLSNEDDIKDDIEDNICHLSSCPELVVELGCKRKECIYDSDYALFEKQLERLFKELQACGQIKDVIYMYIHPE